jgi:hypothetical protein
MVVIGKRTSELPSDNEPPARNDLVAFVDVSAGRSEYVEMGKFATSEVFVDRGVVLIWNGTDYGPYEFKTLTSPKEFRGPTDPSSVSGVVLNLYDTWIETTL